MAILRDAIREFIDDDCPRMAAALSYYTLFSLPGLLILVLLAAGLVADPAALRGQLLGQVATLVGESAAREVGAILENARAPGAGGPVVVALGIAALVFAATGAFSQLQAALNRAWGVEPDRGGVVRSFLVKRLLSFVMILAMALLLLASLLAQTLLTAFGDLVDAALPAPFSGIFLRVASLVLSVLVATLLFGALFQILPDARVHWRDAWRGAGATAALFVTGNLLLGAYLSHSDPGSAFGAAGSLALILVWVYYSSMICFFGAELTQLLARRRGEGVQPSRGAVRVVLDRRRIPPDPEKGEG